MSEVHYSKMYQMNISTNQMIEASLKKTYQINCSL